MSSRLTAYRAGSGYTMIDGIPADTLGATFGHGETTHMTPVRATVTWANGEPVDCDFEWYAHDPTTGEETLVSTEQTYTPRAEDAGKTLRCTARWHEGIPPA